VLLLHGAEDAAVPVAQSEAFATALSGVGGPVRLDVLPGVTHDTVYSPDVAAAATLTWLESLVTGTPRAGTAE
jgi:dipeptidyl aminopeptidase/acylaminoacyl peptidase